MNLAEFRDRVDSDGPDLARWRDEHRAAAERLLAGDPAARAALDVACRLDGLIARVMQPDASPASVDRVLGALAHPLPAQRRSLLSQLWPAALLDVDLAPARWRVAALAGVACLGVVLGLAGADIDAAESRAAVVSSENMLAQVFEPEPLTGVRP
jgi:hypothetical protein